MPSIGSRPRTNSAPETLGQAATTVTDLIDDGGDLSLEERRQIVDQALVLIEQVYVHLPFKRAMHAVDPVQRLKLVRQRLAQMSPRQFHGEMTSTFIGLRDLHTNYLLPDPFRTMTAFLPFLVEEFFEGDSRHYVVSKLFADFKDRNFDIGAIITHWNGIPIDRAVELNAELQAGSNEAARHARGLDALTIRPLIITGPPDEESVLIRYEADGKDRELGIAWRMLQPDPAPNRVDANSSVSPAARVLGIDIQAEATQRAKKILFAPSAMEVEKRVAALSERGSLGAAESVTSADDMTEVGRLPNFSFRTVSTARGKFGYIRIWNFHAEDADEFVGEFVRIARMLPQRGLIVDVRGNPGGSITAAERLLQVLTPRSIDPERLHFINSPLTLKLCDSDPSLSPWKASIRESVETGATYSHGFPLDSAEAYNRLGQQYYGGIVLVTDALCYSATDIFAAGFQDHEIGPMLGTSRNTGAGGANVWTHELLRQVLPEPDTPFTSLPKNASFRVAIRRTTRVGARSGTPVEDIGIVPDHLHHMTRADLLDGNKDLIAHAAELLAGLTAREFSATVGARRGKAINLSLSTKNVSRVDIFLNERPLMSRDVSDGSTNLVVTLPTPGTGILELRGFEDDRPVALRRIALDRETGIPRRETKPQNVPLQSVSPKDAYDLVSNLHDQGLINLDEPMRTYLNRSRSQILDEGQSWYLIVGSHLVLP